MPYAPAGATSPATLEIISAASVNATVVKAGPGEWKGFIFSNQHATAWAWLKLYNKTTAPVPATDAAVREMTIGLPPATTGFLNLRNANGEGLAAGTGLALAITADEATADATAVTAGDVVVNVLYD